MRDDCGIGLAQLGDDHVGDVEGRIGCELCITRRCGKDQFAAMVLHRLRRRFANLGEQIGAEPQVPRTSGRGDELLHGANRECEEMAAHRVTSRKPLLLWRAWRRKASMAEPDAERARGESRYVASLLAWTIVVPGRPSD